MSAERPILIVDDDGVLRETLADQLAVDGEFTAVAAGTIGEAEEKLNAKDARFDAVILDVGLPDGDGRDLCTKLRRQGQKMPIIMLTGSDAETDVVRGLDSGANDYIAKPFRLNELLARLRAQLRIFENSEDAVFTIGPYTFRPSAKLLQDPAKNRRIRLTEKEAAILKFLYRAGTRAVARQVLLNEVWGYNAAVTTHTLETHIYRLRQKIEPDPANARLLVTEGGGYRLDPEGVPGLGRGSLAGQLDHFPQISNEGAVLPGLCLLIGHPQQVGRVHGDECRLSVGHFDWPAALAGDGDGAPKHRTRGGPTHRHHQLRPQPHQFDVEPEAAGLDLGRLGGFVDAPLAARFELEVFHRVGDVDRAPVDARLLHCAIHDLPGRTDERTADHVFLVARLLADEQQTWHARAPRRTPSVTPASWRWQRRQSDASCIASCSGGSGCSGSTTGPSGGRSGGRGTSSSCSASGIAVPIRAWRSRLALMLLPP